VIETARTGKERMSSRTTILRGAATVAAAMLTAAVVVLGAAPAAQAHDELLDSTPASGERLSTAPASVSLTFSADVLTLGAVIIVVDADDRDWVTGDIAVQGGVVSAHMAEGMPADGYEVRWRVVSGDGHPISGVIPFTVGGGAPIFRQPVASDAATGAETNAQAGSQITQVPGLARVLVVGAIGAAIAAVVVALAFFIHRRRSRTGGTDTPST
jgi:hypothetical protein